MISEGVKVPLRVPMKTNHYEKQRILLVRNSALEAENKIRTIKSTVQPASECHHPSVFVGMRWRKPLNKMSVLGSIFPYEENNYIVLGTME